MTEPRHVDSWRELDLAAGGRSLIEASAGTGKTWTIAVLYLRLLLEGEAPHTPRQIVVGTFSEAAAQELRERLRARLLWGEAAAERALRGEAPAADGDDAQWLHARWHAAAPRARLDLLRLRLALTELDLAPIGTLHSLCRRILADFPLESGSAFAAGEVIAEAGVLELLVDDLWRDLMQREQALDAGDLAWVKAGRAALREALRVVLAPGVGVRADTDIAPPSADDWAAVLAATRELVAQPERFKRPDSKLLTALRGLVLADATAAEFDGNSVLTHADMLDKQLKPAYLTDTATIAALTQVFAILQRRGRAGAACKAVALERYRQRLLQRRRDHLLRESSLTFNLLIEGAARALRDPAGALAARLREHWPVALVDEFQDTDAQQYAILDAIYRDAQGRHCGRLVMIGDPKQAIYRFRGGDIRTYLAAAQTAGEVLRLDTNRRSSQDYVAALNTFYAQAGVVLSMRPQHPIRYLPVRAAGRAQPYVEADGSVVARPLQVHYCSDDPRSAESRRERALQACARQIAGLLQQGRRIGATPLQPGDIAVLVPKNQHIERLRALLQQRGVPCVGAGKRSVFDTELARELQLLLYAVEHCQDDAALRAALATRFGGRGYAALAALREDTDAWQLQRRRFQTLRREWQRHGVLGVVLGLSGDLAASVPRLAERERVLTDLRHLGELLQAQSEQISGAEQLLAWFAQQRAAADGGDAADEQQLRLESDAQRVHLSTLHASKGLEFPVVILPLMWDHSGREPSLPLSYDATSGLRLAELAEGRERALQTAREEDQDERLRVLYVALTRAQYACHVYALPPQRPLNAKSNSPAVDPERSALDATLARLQATPDELPPGDRHWAWCADDWAWPEAPYQAVETTDLQGLSARREPPRPVLEHTYSFTALVAGRGRGEQEEAAADDENAARDDALALRPEAMAVTPVADPRIAQLAPLRGADFGNAVHAVFERRALGMPLQAQHALIERSLREHAVRPAAGTAEATVAALAALVQRSLDLPLVDGIALAALAPHQLRAEMAFQFVLDGVDLRRLRETCAQHGAADLVPADLPAQALVGLMSGKIDLVFEHAGRFHVLDYKTNYLGDALADYAPQRLELAMQQHHYGFQALLYTLAVERYLRQRLPQYVREQHLGDAIYLFVRASGLYGDAGVWRRRFAPALLDAVDALFAAAPRGARR